MADMEGDWREELITALPGELRIYRTDIPATDRRVTLMQDALYRSYVAHRSMGYPQAPVPSYYLEIINTCIGIRCSGMFANFKTLLRMTKPLYVIAAVCLWIFSSCQSADYKYEAVYRNLPFDMPRVEAPRFPDRTVNLKEFNAVGNGKLYVHRLCRCNQCPSEQGEGILLFLPVFGLQDQSY